MAKHKHQRTHARQQTDPAIMGRSCVNRTGVDREAVVGEVQARAAGASRHAGDAPTQAAHGAQHGFGERVRGGEWSDEEEEDVHEGEGEAQGDGR